MGTTFNEWLNQLGRAGKGPLSLPPAIRGEAWSCPVELEGDWTGSSLTGAVRIAPDAPSVVVNFTISGPVFDNDVTSFILSLDGNQTDSPVIPSDVDADGVTQLPFLLRLTPSGGIEEPLLGGSFTVLGNV